MNHCKLHIRTFSSHQLFHNFMPLTLKALKVPYDYTVRLNYVTAHDLVKTNFTCSNTNRKNGAEALMY